MNTLNLENINKQAPYKVTINPEYPYLYYFHTDYDVDYEICIKANDIFVPSGAYALDLEINTIIHPLAIRSSDKR